MTVAFELDGQKLVALNGGPDFRFSEAVSFVVDCETQEEVDSFWEKLSEGGDEKAPIEGAVVGEHELQKPVDPEAE